MPTCPGLELHVPTLRAHNVLFRVTGRGTDPGTPAWRANVSIRAARKGIKD